MNNTLDLKFLLSDTRARVYLLWAFLASSGFLATHYYQQDKINALWFTISVIGLGYMFKVMPLKIHSMRNIFLAWLVPIAFGMTVSGLAFKVDSLTGIIPYLGAFWLLVMATGYAANGLVDPPSNWYWFAATLNAAAAIACFAIEPFTTAQYLVAAIVSAWSMLNLWIFRT
ncbi:MAG: hypothetical protein ACR2FM_03255 [Candidatus Saccharimonadales bacterium]